MNFRDFLTYAERFYEEAQMEPTALQAASVQRFCAASVIFSGIAMEAFINDMMADFAALPVDMFSVHERAFLEEHAVDFVTTGPEIGQFRITGRQEFRGLDHKIMFLVAKFGKGTSIDKGSGWWQKFEATKDKRNKIVHPRKDMNVIISTVDASDALAVAKEVIRVVSLAVWGKPADI